MGQAPIFGGNGLLGTLVVAQEKTRAMRCAPQMIDQVNACARILAMQAAQYRACAHHRLRTQLMPGFLVVR